MAFSELLCLTALLSSDVRLVHQTNEALLPPAVLSSSTIVIDYRSLRSPRRRRCARSVGAVGYIERQDDQCVGCQV